jgi:hypothetical protein
LAVEAILTGGGATFLIKSQYSLLYTNLCDKFPNSIIALMPEKPVNSILKVLAYFDIFQYPLTQEEIYSFLEQQISPEKVQALLHQMIEQQQIFRQGEFYSLQNNTALGEKRTARNAYARKMLPVAYRIGSILYRFPYVRGIFISGSLSKNCADHNSDIDFFIITSANRLWIARTCLLLFRRLVYITGKQRFYCLNYFVDEEAQCIEEQNIFTATELATLVPVCGNGAIEQFFDNNTWTKHYLPNRVLGKKALLANRSSLFKKCMEWLLNNRLGDAIENYLLRITARRWQRREKERRRDPNGYPKSMIYTPHISKPNPAYYHQMILNAYEQKLKDIEDQSPARFLSVII